MADSGGIGGVAGGLGGAIGGIAGLLMAGRSGTREYEQAVKVWEGLQLSNFDYSKVTGQDLQLLQKYFPEQYNAVVPDEIKLAQESSLGRSGQVQALSGMQQIAQEGMPEADRLSAKIAGNQMAGELQRQQNGLVSDLAQRGRLGGGEEIAARIGGQQASTQYAADLADRLAQTAMARRMEALTGSSDISNRIRSGDINLSKMNADAINNFNMQKSQIQNAANLQNTQMKNQAQQMNINAGQNVANANIGRRNENEWKNLLNKNDLMGRSTQERLAKAQGLSGSLQALGGQRDADRAMTVGMGNAIGQGVGQTAGGLFDWYQGGGFG